MNNRPTLAQQLGAPRCAVPVPPRRLDGVRWIERGSIAHALLEVLDDVFPDRLPSPILIEEAMVGAGLAHPRLNWLLSRGLVRREAAPSLADCDMPGVRWLYGLAPQWRGRWRALVRPPRGAAR